MPNDETELTIEEVAQPWYVRHRNWLVAGAVAGGLVALGHIRNQKNVSRNPYRSKHEEFWLLPMDIGDTRSAEPGKDTEVLRRWMDRTWGLRSGGRFGGRDLKKAIIDSVLQLYKALGRPLTVDKDADLLIQRAISKDSVNRQTYWGQNIVNLRWLFVAAQKNKDLLRWVWYAIHVPAIAKLSPEDQRRVFRIIDELPQKERWRVKWYYDSIHPLAAPVGFLSADYSYDNKDNYHHGHLDIKSDSGYTLGEAVSLPYKKFLEKIELINDQYGKSPKLNLWHEAHEFEPKKNELINLTSRAIVNFPKREYLRAYRYLKNDRGLQEADRIRGAIGLSFVFGSDWKKWLDGMKDKGHDAHTATFWLPVNPAPGLGKFLRRRFLSLEKIGINEINQMNAIADAWNVLPAAVKRETTKNIMRYVTSAKYENVRDELFAQEAARWGVDEDEYSELEERFLKGVGSEKTIPSLVLNKNGMRLFKLDQSDPRGLFLGRHTVCCQAPEMEGEACAWYGVESPKSGFYVVVDDIGSIIAQSWVWRHADVIVFDNIEGPGVQSSATRNHVIAMYKKLANELIKFDPTLNEVRVGDTVDRRPGGKRYIDWDAPIAKKSDVGIIPPPFDFFESAMDDGGEPYTDSMDRQFILAKRGKGTVFFKSEIYMDVLAHLLALAWGDEDSIYYNDSDLSKAVAYIVEQSPFSANCDVKHRIPESYTQRGHEFIGCFEVSIYLWGVFEDNRTRTALSFDTDVCLEGEYEDIELQGFIQQIVSVGQGTDAERHILESLGIEFDEDDFELEPELPRQEPYWDMASYVVAIDMEDFRGYRNEDDAIFIKGLLDSIIWKRSSYNVVEVLKKLNDEEVEEYEESDQLDEECFELRPDEWWCFL